MRAPLSCLSVQQWGNWDGFCSAMLLSVRSKLNHLKAKARGQHLRDMQERPSSTWVVAPRGFWGQFTQMRDSSIFK